MNPSDTPVLVTGHDTTVEVEWLAEVYPDGYSELKFRPKSGGSWSPPIPHLLITGGDL